MATAYRALGALASGTGTSIVVSKPAGVAAGDLLIALFTLADNTLITPPDGWVNIRNDAFPYSNAASSLYKVAGGSEPESYTFTLASSQAYGARIVALYSTRGRTLTVGTWTGEGTNDLSATLDIPSLTMDKAGGAIVGLLTVRNEATADWGTMTPLYYDATPTEYTHGAYELIAAAGETGAREITISTPEYWTTHGIPVWESVEANVHVCNVAVE